MKKNLLPLAMLAGLAGAAGTARDLESGKVMIYPFYACDDVPKSLSNCQRPSKKKGKGHRYGRPK